MLTRCLQPLLLWLLLPGFAKACAEPNGFELIDHSRIAVFGEYYGTNEIPKFFENVACTLVNRTEGPLVVALELPDDLNALFARVGTDPQSEIISHIRNLPFWDVFGDGRHSRAMLQLVEALVAMADAEPRIRLTAFARTNISIDGADFLSKVIRRNSAERTLILVGNAHARLTPMNNNRPTLVMNLRDSHGLDVRTFDVSASAGEAWICLPECAARQVFPSQRQPGIHGAECTSGCAYHGSFHLPALSVSPAVDAR